MSDTDDGLDEDNDEAGPPQDLSSPEAAEREDADQKANVHAGSGETRRRGERVISEKTRELFVKGTKEIAKQIAEEEAEDGYEDEEPVLPTAAGAVKPQGDRVAPGQPTAPAAASAPVAPPAPSLDPQVTQLREQWTTRNAELDKREAAIAARETSADELAVTEQYLENEADAVLDFVKKHSGIATDGELADEVADLIVALSARVHKLPLEPAVQSRLDAKRSLRYVKAQKVALSKREEETTKRQSAAQQEIEITRAKEALGREIQKPEVAKQYPFLAVEDNAGEIVFEVVEAQFKKDGTTLAWTEAAKRADEYLKRQVSAYHDKRKHLLDASQARGIVGADVNGAPGDPSGIRRSRSLTNAATATAPATPPEPKTDGKWDPEKHRAQTKRKMRQAFAAATAEPNE